MCLDESSAVFLTDDFRGLRTPTPELQASLLVITVSPSLSVVVVQADVFFQSNYKLSKGKPSRSLEHFDIFFTAFVTHGRVVGS